MRNIGECWRMRCAAGMYEESKEENSDAKTFSEQTL